MPLVLTVDQRSSSDGPDRVPAMLERLAPVAALRGFRRTAGDEFQGILDDPDSLPRALEPLLRDGNWWVGIGVGDVVTPLPVHANEGRGAAYLRAREAVTAAKQAVRPVRVAGPEPAVAEQLESAIWLWAALLDRRTDKGWEVADLLDEGLSHERVAQRLGITQSAVSQRARAAGVVEGGRARALVAHLAAACLEQSG